MAKIVPPDLDANRLRKRLEYLTRETVILEMRAKKSTKEYESDWMPGPTWDGGETINGSNRKPVWGKLLQVILQNGFDPVSYLRMQFTLMRVSPRSVNDLMSAKALLRYREAMAKDGQEIKQDLKIQLKRFEVEAGLLQDAGFTAVDSWVSVLADDEAPLSALFRYCASRHIKDPKAKGLRTKYLDQAQFQYLSHADLYDEYWADFLSRKFKKWSRDLGTQIGMKF